MSIERGPASLFCRWLWRAVLREPWSPATHARFPPDFQAAVRALLLAAQRGAGAAATGSNEGAGRLAQLPPDVLQRIVGLAAYPLSAWVPHAYGDWSGDTLRSASDSEELSESDAEDQEE